MRNGKDKTEQGSKQESEQISTLGGRSENIWTTNNPKGKRFMQFEEKPK